MNVTCPDCRTIYRVDPRKVPSGGVRARCARCPAEFAVDSLSGDASSPFASGLHESSGATSKPSAADGMRSDLIAGYPEMLAGDDADRDLVEDGAEGRVPGFETERDGGHGGGSSYETDLGSSALDGDAEREGRDASTEVWSGASDSGLENGSSGVTGEADDTYQEEAPESASAWGSDFQGDARGDEADGGNVSLDREPVVDESGAVDVGVSGLDNTSDTAGSAESDEGCAEDTRRTEMEELHHSSNEAWEQDADVAEASRQPEINAYGAIQRVDGRIDDEGPRDGLGSGDDYGDEANVDLDSEHVDHLDSRPSRLERVTVSAVSSLPEEQAPADAAEEDGRGLGTESMVQGDEAETAAEEPSMPSVIAEVEAETVAQLSEPVLAAPVPGTIESPEGFSAVPVRPNHDAPLPPSPFGSADPHARARRLARALVSDIVVYNPDRRERSVRLGTVRQEFREEIRKSWEEYVAHVGSQVARDTTYFRDALNELLAGGNRLF